MKFRIGALKHLVRFHLGLISQNDTGEEIINWIESNQVWAKYDAKMSSQESQDGTGVIAKGNAIFTIRYLKAIDEKMRIVFEDNVYDIHSVLHDNNFEYTQIEAQRIETAKPLYWTDGQGNIWEDGNGSAWVIKDAYTAPSITGLEFQDANSNQWVMT